jgi:undecaprenol kinase/diacylglycerol kinase (ATP)
MIRFLKRLGYAFSGIILLIRTERHFQIHTIAFALVIFIGSYFKISEMEWVALLLLSGFVLVAEAINSSIERLSDEITKDYNWQIKQVKDIAAGAVLIATLIAIAGGIIIFYPYLEALFH